MTAGGVTYDAHCLANIRFSRALAGKGFDGVATSELSCDILTDSPPSEGDTVTLSGFVGIPVTVISSCEYSNGVAKIKAYDRCKNLDIPFDYSSFDQFDSNEKTVWYSPSLVVSAIAAQCGFSSGGYIGAVTKLCYNDFAKKTCRQILTDISKASAGHWLASGNSLVFLDFSPPSGGDTLDEKNRSEIILKGSKTISAIYAEDETYGTEYMAGSSSWEHTERISGRYFHRAAAAAAASKIFSDGGQYVYNGWECSSVLTDTLYNIGDYISYSGRFLPVLRADFDFTDMGIIASLSAPKADGSFSEYSDLYSRKIEGKLPFDTLFGCSSATHQGFCLVGKKEALVNSG